MTRPDVALFYPPWTQTTALSGPHLAPAQLCAHLHAEGVSCRTIDLNIRFLHWLARPDGPLDQRLASHVRAVRHLRSRAPLGREQLEAARAGLSFLVQVPLQVLESSLGQRGRAARTDHSEDWSLCRARALALPWGFSFLFAPDAESTRVLFGTVDETIDRLGSGEADLFDEYFDAPDTSALLEQVLGASVVGISVCFAPQLAAALRLARRLRRLSDALLILGGTHLTLLSPAERARIVQLSFVDAIAKNQGELTLQALAAARGSREALARAPNLTYKSGGTIRETALAPPIDLSRLTTPRFEPECLALYPRQAPLPVLVTQGCYWDRCAFCDERQLRAESGRGYCCRSAAGVADHVQALMARHGARHFNLITDAAPPSWCSKFAREVLARRLGADFSCFLRNHTPKVYSPEFAHLLHAAGLRTVVFGVESFSNRVLGVMNKGSSREERLDNIRTFAAAGVRISVNMMPDFPGTEYEEAVEDLRCILEHKDCITRVNSHRFRLAGTSEMRARAADFGIELESANEVFVPSLFSSAMLFKRVSGMSERQRSRILAAFDTLENDLEIYHLTARNRERIATAGFAWDQACFALRRCILVPAHISLAADGAQRDVDYIVVPAVASFLEMPRALRRVTRLLAMGTRGSIDFARLLGAYRSATPAASPERARQGCVALLKSLVHCGLVKEVFPGPPMRPSPAISAVLAPTAEDPQ